MKCFVLLLTGLMVICSCKKTIQQKEENVIMKAMTDGQWVITNFTLDGSDVTSDFDGYTFQYFSNNTVNAIKNGSVQNTGSWDGDINTMSISANFPSMANPLLLLNGTWHVTDNSWTFVKATLTYGREIRTLRLDKQ